MSRCLYVSSRKSSHNTNTLSALMPGPKNRPNGESLPGPGIWTQSAAYLGVRFSDPLFHIAQPSLCLVICSHRPLPSLPTLSSWQRLTAAGGEDWPGSTWPAPSLSLNLVCAVTLVKRAQNKLHGGVNTHSARHSSACLEPQNSEAGKRDSSLSYTEAP